MNNTIIAFLLTFIAGLSTLIGTIIIFFPFKKREKIITCCLAFSSSIMMSISILELIPESLTYFKYSPQAIFYTMIFLILGIIISMMINYFLPDKYESVSNSNLLKVGLISCFALIIHNIPEGMITFISTSNCLSLGIMMTIAIAIHNIPEGISISIPIYYATNKRYLAIIYTLISALSEPFGALITYLFLANYLNDFVLGILFSLTAGIMLQISLGELLPQARKYFYKYHLRLFFILGMILMTIEIYFLN